MTKKHVSGLLVVILNTNKVLEYNRHIPLSTNQLRDLEVLDQKLENSLKLDYPQNHGSSPQDKATYAANMLISALLNEDEPRIALTCAFLATRYSELKQIKASSQADQIAIELIFDQEYRESAPIKFVPKDDLN